MSRLSVPSSLVQGTLGHGLAAEGRRPARGYGLGGASLQARDIGAINQLFMLDLKQGTDWCNVESTFLTKAWNCSARTASALLSQALGGV